LRTAASGLRASRPICPPPPEATCRAEELTFARAKTLHPAAETVTLPNGGSRGVAGTGPRSFLHTSSGCLSGTRACPSCARVERWRGRGAPPCTVLSVNGSLLLSLVKRRAPPCCCSPLFLNARVPPIWGGQLRYGMGGDAFVSDENRFAGNGVDTTLFAPGDSQPRPRDHACAAHCEMRSCAVR